MNLNQEDNTDRMYSFSFPSRGDNRIDKREDYGHDIGENSTHQDSVVAKRNYRTERTYGIPVLEEH